MQRRNPVTARWKIPYTHIYAKTETYIITKWKITFTCAYTPTGDPINSTMLLQTRNARTNGTTLLMMRNNQMNLCILLIL